MSERFASARAAKRRRSSRTRRNGRAQRDGTVRQVLGYARSECRLRFRPSVTGSIQVDLTRIRPQEGDQMNRTWTIIGVVDVPGSFKWYQALFGQPPTLPAHDDFGQILDSDGTVLLCLHEWGAHEHPSLMSPDRGTPGNGLLLFFRVDDFDLALQRARSLVTRLEEEPHRGERGRAPTGGFLADYGHS